MIKLTGFDKFIIFLISCYFIIFSVITVNRYWQYQNFYFDFGIYDEAIWKVAHFKLPIVDKGENGQINLSDHFTPGMYLLAPIYWITDRREVMFVAQTLTISLGAWFAYLIAKARTNNRLFQTSLVVSFLGFVGMQNALIADIHEITFAVLPLMLAFWAIERKKWRQYYFFLFLMLSFKENMAGVAIGLGMYLLIRYRKKFLQHSLLSMAIGLVWGVLTTMVIIPALNHGLYAYEPVHLAGLRFIKIISMFVSSGLKRETIIYTLSTFGFLPLFDIGSWPLIFEHYLERFVLSGVQTRIDLGLHYNSILVPILIMGSLNTMSIIQKRIQPKVISLFSIGLIIWVIFFSRFIYHGPIDLFYNPAFYDQKSHVAYQDDFVKIFPDSGLVLTQNDLAVRLTHGPDIRLLRREFALLNPDYVILNLTPGQNPNSYYPGGIEIAQEIRDYYLSDKNYSLTKVHDEQYLFIRNKPIQ